MHNKRAFYGIAIAILLFPLATFAQWSGYLNTNTTTEIHYGFMATESPDAASGKLRFLCLSDNRFYLLFDQQIIGPGADTVVTVSVDSLPELSFQLGKFGEDYAVSDQAAKFFQLVAQMVAGSRITIDAEHKYSLHSFTNTYRSACGSFDAYARYQQFLHLYR